MENTNGLTPLEALTDCLRERGADATYFKGSDSIGPSVFVWMHPGFAFDVEPPKMVDGVERWKVGVNIGGDDCSNYIDLSFVRQPSQSIAHMIDDVWPFLQQMEASTAPIGEYGHSGLTWSGLESFDSMLMTRSLLSIHHTPLLQYQTNIKIRHPRSRGISEIQKVESLLDRAVKNALREYASAAKSDEAAV